MMKKILFLILCAGSLTAFANENSPFVQSCGGKGSEQPAGYAPVFIANGSIATFIDNLGMQRAKMYVKLYPEVVWAGRRYPSGGSTPIPMGRFEESVSIDGKPLGEPLGWKQTLDARNAVTTCEVEYENAVVKTAAFVPYGLDMLVVQKSVEAKDKGAKAVKIKFAYSLTSAHTGKTPDRVLVYPKADSKSAVMSYTAYAYKIYHGEIGVNSDVESRVSLGENSVSLESEFDLSKGSARVAYFVSFADDFDNPQVGKRAAALKKIAAEKGFDGILKEHSANWQKYFEGAFINLPDERMNAAYAVALYHLRSMSTKWSFPVGLAVRSGWGGRFFGWDETFCVFGALSSGKAELAVKTANFRRKMLDIAMNRVAHYGAKKPMLYGARYPWESLEDGAEGAPNPYGFWFDHIFHMSNIAVSEWENYLYSGDNDFLRETAYPVMRECAAFYYSHMLYKDENGQTIVGKCTDLERLGPARENPFLTSCGVIYTFEKTAEAAKILGVDAQYAAKLKEAAARLRKSLPQNGEMYIPYAGCKEKSIASVGGLFPYFIFDKSDKKQVAAVYDFMKNISTAGNMYPVGGSTCSWYAGWLSSALALIEDAEGPEAMLSAAAKNTGHFAETWEIYEPNTRHTPWFTTAAGNYLHAVNQMLVSSRENGEIYVAPSVPEKWKNFEFELPCYYGAKLRVKAEDGKITKLIFSAPDSRPRALAVPTRLLPANKIPKSAEIRGRFTIIRIEGRFEL